MSTHPTFPCPSCEEEAPRLFSGEVFGFGFKTSSSDVNGLSPSNTGVHDLDYPSADKAVGRSAEARWQTYRDRDAIKEKVRKNSKVTQLTRTDGEGYMDYASMSPGQREERKRLVKLATSLKVRSKTQ